MVGCLCYLFLTVWLYDMKKAYSSFQNVKTLGYFGLVTAFIGNMTYHMVLPCSDMVLKCAGQVKIIVIKNFVRSCIIEVRFGNTLLLLTLCLPQRHDHICRM